MRLSDRNLPSSYITDILSKEKYFESFFKHIFGFEMFSHYKFEIG